MSAGEETFDLLTQRWIPVRLGDTSIGQGMPDPATAETQGLSLLETLENAERITRIVDASPLVTCALYRFLFALASWYLPLADDEEWSEQWANPQFGSELAAVVRQRCAGSLTLFSPDRPFGQSGEIPLTGKPVEPLKSVGYLAPEASTGTNIAHFDHASEAEHQFCPACCAKGLLVQSAFATAGGAGIKPGINGVPPLYVIPRGGTLRETLLLNRMLPHRLPPLAAAADPGPLWEQQSAVVARGVEQSTTGFVESLTWPPRRVRLFPGPGGMCSRCGREAAVLVRKMVYAQGWSRKKELPLWQDPWAAYRNNSKPKPGMPAQTPVRPTESGDAWRDFPSLFLNDLPATSTRPAVLDQIAALVHDGWLEDDREVTHELFGLRTDMKAKIFEWRRDSFQFPPRLLGDPYAQQEIRRALEHARDGGESALRAGLRKLLQDEGEFDFRTPLAAIALRRYWQTLEAGFRNALHDPRLLAGEEGRAAWSEAWWGLVSQTVRDELHTAEEALEARGDTWRRRTEATELCGRLLGGYRKKMGLTQRKGAAA